MSAIPTVTLTDSDSDDDSIDIIEEFKQPNDTTTNSDDSDSDCQFIDIVPGEIEVLNVIVDKTGCEIIEPKTVAQTSRSNDNDLNRSLPSDGNQSFSSTKTVVKQLLATNNIKQELSANDTIKTEFFTIDDDSNDTEFNDASDETLRSDDIKSELIADTISTAIDNNVTNNDNNVSMDSIAENVDENLIENSGDKTVVNVNTVSVEQQLESNNIDSVIDLDSNDESDKNTVIIDVNNSTEQQSAQNLTTISDKILGINLNLNDDSFSSHNTDICDTSFDVTKTSISNNKISIANTTQQSSIGIASKSRPKPRSKQKRPEDRYDCLKCDFVTWNLVDLIYHNGEHRSIFRCKHQLCTYDTNSKEMLDIHMQKHSSMRRLCLKCFKETDCDCGENNCENSVKISSEVNNL